MLFRRSNPRIFISYRRDDSLQIANRIAERLRKRYGKRKVFFDTGGAIRPGTYFDDRIREALGNSNIVLVLIGKDWISHLQQRENQSTKDYVLLEVKRALQLEKERRNFKEPFFVIPLLLDGASMPSEDALNAEIVSLTRLQASKVGSGENFDLDMRRLYRSIDGLTSVSEIRFWGKRVGLVIGFALILGLLFQTVAYYLPIQQYPIIRSINERNCYDSREIDQDLRTMDVSRYSAEGDSPIGGGLGIIVFDRGPANSQRQTFMLDLTTMEIREALANDRGSYISDLSPDGQRIAYNSRRTNDWIFPEPLFSYTSALGGGNDQPLLPQQSFYDLSGPDWSPDGSKIAFQGFRAGVYSLYVLDEGSQEPRPITVGGDDLIPDWSPDGLSLVFQSSRTGTGCRDIYVVSSDGRGEPEARTDTLAHDYYPKWSPDGTQIAFMSNRSGDFEIYVMDADGGNVRQLTANRIHDRAPVWSPDGEYIAFISNRDSEYKLYALLLQENKLYILANDVSSSSRLAWR